MIFRRKKKLLNKEFLKQIFLMLIGLFVLILISIPLARNMSQRYQVNGEINNLKKEIAELKGKNNDLQDFIKYLNSDSFIEEQARLKLNYKKEGEEVFVLKDLDKEEENNYTYSKEPEFMKKRENNFYKWWKYFFEN